MKGSIRFPRAYGGVSKYYRLLQNRIPFSPCLRGCFLYHLCDISQSLVFPVLTGVFLQGICSSKGYFGFPRAYGGVSTVYKYVSQGLMFSPCLRGCFQTQNWRMLSIPVFPVLTGVFPFIVIFILSSPCFPRAYGGVSFRWLAIPYVHAFSPCLRGCFLTCFNLLFFAKVFPVLTGVFLVPIA